MVKSSIIFTHRFVLRGPSKYTDSVLGSLRLFKQRVVGLDQNYRREDERPDFIVYQVLAQLPFELDVVFKSHSHLEGKIKDLNFESELSHWRREFDAKFETTFGLMKRGFDNKALRFAQAAMSNMIGGIGYFYGQSLVQSERSKHPVKYWEAPLYTAVPSRSFFPRGFLWDEGFHNLLISKWNPAISADIVGHWMDLINDEGWIPREQILGLEARAKVINYLLTSFLYYSIIFGLNQTFFDIISKLNYYVTYIHIINYF